MDRVSFQINTNKYAADNGDKDIQFKARRIYRYWLKDIFEPDIVIIDNYNNLLLIMCLIIVVWYMDQIYEKISHKLFTIPNVYNYLKIGAHQGLSYWEL